jgi:hypothetical protein
MRKGGRAVLVLLVVSIMGTKAPGAPWERSKSSPAPDELVAMTIELSWSSPANAARENAPGESSTPAPPSEVSLGVTNGQVVEAVFWPRSPDHSNRATPRRGIDADWLLGSEGAGKLRARLEVTLGAELVVRRGKQVVRVPVVSILERPQHTPDQSPLTLSVERLPWDSLAIETGQGAEEGVVAPATSVPVLIQYNILWPEATEVSVRTTAVLRPLGSTEVLWKSEVRELVPANRLDPPPRLWKVPAPGAEGTFVLEVHADWEPSSARETSRLGRLIRRRKPAPVCSEATRRVLFAVVSPQEQATFPARPGAAEIVGRETEVDSVDLTRVRSSRFSAWGRSPILKPNRTLWELPAELLQEPSHRERERLLSLITRTPAEMSSLGPANESGLSWAAVGLRLSRPEKPHRLTVTVRGGDPTALGVALVDIGAGDRRPRIVLDACASGSPISKDGAPATFSWLIWPDAPALQLLLLNRNPSAAVRLGTVKLVELDRLPGAPQFRVPDTPATRTIGLYLTGRSTLERFGGTIENGLADPLETARNLLSYATYCGASMVVVPEHLSDRQARRGLHGQLEEDATGPDQLDLILRLLRRQGYSAWLELSFDGKDALPDLPPPDSAQALGQGLVRVDRQGLADGPTYHPLHPAVRQAMKRRVEQALARRGEGAGVSGVLIQLGPGPTLLGSPETGMDDETFTRFVHETFGAETAGDIPGLAMTDADRFAARTRYLSGVGRVPWLTWRSRAIAALYSELAAAARTASPGAAVALATPLLYGGAAGAEARRVDLAGLAPSQAWRSVGLDLQTWSPDGPDALIVLRGIALSSDPLAHDLATSPDLDAKVAGFDRRGTLLSIDSESSQGNSGATLALSALPLGEGFAADEPLEHALAAIDAHWVILGVPAIDGHEDRVRKFASIFRSLPAWQPREPSRSADQKDPGVVVRSLTDQTQTFLEIANDTPYPIRLAGLVEAPESAAVEDIGRNLRLMPQPASGGRQLVIDLLPFGASAIRIAAPRVELTKITPYPSEAVLSSMETRYHELSTQLARLNRSVGSGVSEPPNPGFEPEPSGPVQRTQITPGEPAATAPVDKVAGGWTVDGAKSAQIQIDASNPHSGQGSLKLTAPEAPAAVQSGDFVPGGWSTLTIQVHARAEPADSLVRLWLQSEADGQPYFRRSEFRVPSSWEPRAVRVVDLPAGGLDRARLRFEMLSPGSLWIDDLKVFGDAAPRAVRLNAQRTLLAALQAYRAQHYAEFARLSGSHWARHPTMMTAGRTELLGTSSATPGAAEASALPPDHRLR